MDPKPARDDRRARRAARRTTRVASLAGPSCARRWVTGAALLATVVTLSGCLDKPRIEDRWTRLDIQSASVSPRAPLAPETQPFTVQMTVTYRSILTGFAVAELRAADSTGVAPTAVDLGAPRVPMAEAIDDVLAHSRSLGRATRAVTGWDHLIQPLDFTFSATPQAGSRLFFLCYLGSGERIELPSGGDSVLITPFVSSEQQVLPIGMELHLAGTP